VINNNENSRPDTTTRTEGTGVFRIILGELSSAKLATAVGSLIVVACILGTLLPQGGDVQKYLRANPQHASQMKFLASVGLANVFESWWFIGLLVFFSLNVVACLIRRMSNLIKSGRMGTSGWGFLLTHMSLLLILGGAVIRGAVGQKGEMEIREGETQAHFMTPTGPTRLPFDVRLVKFNLEYYDEKTDANPDADKPDMLSIAWPERHIETQVVVEVGTSIISLHPDKETQTESNAVNVTVSRYEPDFVIDMNTHEAGSRSGSPNNPAILVEVNSGDVHVSKWIFARHPDFDMLHSPSDKGAAGNLKLLYLSNGAENEDSFQNRSRPIRSFKSKLQLLEDSNVLVEKTIEVNSPLSFRGYTLYQSGYNPGDLTQSTLEVVHDPGVPVVYAGFLSMVSGLILLLCFKPAGRKKPAANQPSVSEGQLP
jgi:hypothetical protein